MKKTILLIILLISAVSLFKSEHDGSEPPKPLLPQYDSLLHNAEEPPFDGKEHVPSLSVLTKIQNPASDESQQAGNGMFQKLQWCLSELERMNGDAIDQNSQPEPTSDIFILLTDTAEPDLSSIQFLKDPHLEKEYETYIFVFCDDSSDVKDETRYCYFIIKGKVPYIKNFLDNLKELLKAVKLEENQNYFVAGNHVEPDRTRLEESQIVVMPSATYDETKEEIRSGISSLSKNVRRIGSVDDLFISGTKRRTILAFQYAKTEGLDKNNEDWRINLYIPLHNSSGTDISYQYESEVYYVAKDASGEDIWTEFPGSEVQIEQKEIKEYKNALVGYPSAYYVKLSGGLKEKDRVNQILILIRVTRTERLRFQIPEWTDELGVKEYCNSIFRYQNEHGVNNQSEYLSIYAEIPVLIVGLNQE